MPRIKPVSVFQAHLPLKSRVPARAVAAPFTLEKRTLSILGAGLLLMVMLYSYFIMLSVSHVALREQVLYEAERLASDVAALEQDYLARSVLITKDTALAQGFTQTRHHIFVERGAVSLGNAR